MKRRKFYGWVSTDPVETYRIARMICDLFPGFTARRNFARAKDLVGSEYTFEITGGDGLYAMELTYYSSYTHTESWIRTPFNLGTEVDAAHSLMYSIVSALKERTAFNGHAVEWLEDRCMPYLKTLYGGPRKTPC